MLEDIKNVMSSKRLNSDSKTSRAFVLDTKTGLQYDVKTDSEFLFGRLLKSSLVIEELYISRSHAIIRCENDQYLLKDNSSCTGTYLNYKKINKEVALQNGDLIGFTDKPKTWDFVYKFCLLPNPNKKPKLEEEKFVAFHEKLKIKIKELQKQVQELKAEKISILNDTKTQMDELKKMVDDTTELNIKINKEMAKYHENYRKSNNEVILLRSRCTLQKELLDTRIAKEEEPVETLKTQVNKLLENDFQCAICNEVIYRPSTANCNHTFCDTCLKTWLARSNYCPTCRSIVHCTTYCLALDNYITNICDLLGGTIKEQRLTLQSERNGHQPQVAKRGRRRGGNQTNRRREPVPPAYPIIDDIPTRFPNGIPNVIAVVDLTNNTSR